MRERAKGLRGCSCSRTQTAKFWNHDPRLHFLDWTNKRSWRTVSGIAPNAAGALAQASPTCGYPSVTVLICAETVFSCRGHLWTSTLRLPLMTKKSRGCGAAQISKSPFLNQREFRPARLAIAAERPADWPLRGSGRQLKSEDRVLASRTVVKARSSGSDS